jgi:hypothetical protein
MSVRRLHKGKFHWPKWGDSTMPLSKEQFALLVSDQVYTINIYMILLIFMARGMAFLGIYYTIST